VTETEVDIESVIQWQARACIKRYRGFTEVEDLEQEGRLWVLSNPKDVADRLDRSTKEQAAYAVGQRIGQAMDRYARKQKALASGYEPEDEVYFTDALIGLVLPSVLKNDTTPPAVAGDRVANTSDPAEGGNWMATYMDVKQAWESAELTDAQRELLVQYHLDDMTLQEIAQEQDVVHTTISRRLSNARRKLIDKLGGLSPREYNTEHDSRPGVKRNEPGIVSQVH
jgi:RNA polymerase sigma factor (sigma-70 family)